MAQDHFMTRCPSCGAENRVPVARVGQKGRCGRCKTELPADQLYSAAPVDLPEAQFDLVTKQSALPVLVDFWAEWCGPCRLVAPVLEKLAQEMAGRLLIAKVDTEAASFIPSRFQVQGIPTLVLLRRGIEVDRVVGAASLDALRARVEPHLNR